MEVPFYNSIEAYEEEMTDRLEIQSQQDTELKKELEKVDWKLDYGSVKIQIRQGRPTLITIERTIQLDTHPSKPEIITRAPDRVIPIHK